MLSLRSLDCIWHSFSFPPFEVYLLLASETFSYHHLSYHTSFQMWTYWGAVLGQTSLFLWTISSCCVLLNTTYILKIPTFTSPTHTPPELQTHISNCWLCTCPWVSNERDLIKSSSQIPYFFTINSVPPIIFAMSLNGSSILLLAQAQDLGIILRSSLPPHSTSNP